MTYLQGGLTARMAKKVPQKWTLLIVAFWGNSSVFVGLTADIDLNQAIEGQRRQKQALEGH